LTIPRIIASCFAADGYVIFFRHPLALTAI
jgi:hypothetical protein